MKSEIDYLRAFITSKSTFVSPPFQVRFKSVPNIEDIASLWGVCKIVLQAVEQSRKRQARYIQSAINVIITILKKLKTVGRLGYFS